MIVVVLSGVGEDAGVLSQRSVSWEMIDRCRQSHQRLISMLISAAIIHKCLNIVVQVSIQNVIELLFEHLQLSCWTKIQTLNWQNGE